MRHLGLRGRARGLGAHRQHRRGCVSVLVLLPVGRSNRHRHRFRLGRCLGLRRFLLAQTTLALALPSSPLAVRVLGREVLLNAAPLHAKGAQDREAGHDEADLEAHAQRVVIGLQGCGMVRGGDEVEELGGARALDQPGTDARDASEAVGQLIVEHVLADRGEDGAEELLTEEHERHANGHVLARQHRLRGHVGCLRARAEAEAVQNLEANPLALQGVDLEGGEQAGADRCEADAEDHEGRVIADAGDQLAGDDGRHDNGHHHGKKVDAAIDGRDAVNGLEPDRKVIHWRSGISKR